MKASVIAVGEELLVPGRSETNGSFLIERLHALGIPTGFRGVVGDAQDAIRGAVRYALDATELVFLTGGLGPTSDDRTRDAVAGFLSRELWLDEDVLEGIRRRFRERGVPMPDVNQRQALVLEGADVLPNRLGTAPGLWIPVEGDKVVVLLPGPPFELTPMFTEQVEPRLTARGPRLRYHVSRLWLSGMPESVVEERIAPIYRSIANPMTTILASGGQIEVRFTSQAETIEEARGLSEGLSERVHGALGSAVFSTSDETLESVVGRQLLARGQRISVAESLTGGLIADRLTDVPGASSYFDESVVTYSNGAKTERLGVAAELFERVGAVSEEVALAMARGVRRRAGSDVGLAVTGVAGPGGGSAEKPVGLVYIGLVADGTERVERFQFPGDRARVKRFTSQAALNMVRLALM